MYTEWFEKFNLKNMPDLLMKEVEALMTMEFAEKVKVISAKLIGGGCINHAMKLDTNRGQYFLKWNSNCAPDLFVREAEGLNELRKASEDCLKIPKVICVKEVDDSPGFLVQEYLQTGNNSGKTDEMLGRGLANMHNYENSQFGFFETNYCGATVQNNLWKKNWVDFFVENRLRFLVHLIEEKGLFSSGELKLFDKLFDKLPSLLPQKSKAVLIHGDLWSGNYMNTSEGPALIDPAVYYADREMEFSILTMFGGFSNRFFQAYNEINPLEPDWQERNLLYQLYHILNHYYLFGGTYGQQALSISKRFI